MPDLSSLPRRVLVTGAAGFIGSHLVERLLREGCEVVGLDGFDPYYARADKEENLAAARAHPAFRLVEADLRDRPAVERALAGLGPFGAVAHLAARAGVRASFEDPALSSDLNLGATRALTAALDARAPGVPLVFASSSSVYGAAPGPFREDQELGEPLSPYARAKQETERFLDEAHRAGGRPTTMLRLFTVYGPRQRPDMALRRFADRLLRGEAAEMYGDGTTLRDYTEVSDIVDGFARALAAPRPWRVYNLGCGRPIRLDVMLPLLAAALGRELRVREVPQPRGDAPLTWASIERARAELGWEPRVPIEEGVRRAAAWILAHRKPAAGEREA